MSCKSMGLFVGVVVVGAVKFLWGMLKNLEAVNGCTLSPELDSEAVLLLRQNYPHDKLPLPLLY